jgi:hypothetical protein
VPFGFLISCCVTRVTTLAPSPTFPRDVLSFFVVPTLCFTAPRDAAISAKSSSGSGGGCQFPKTAVFGDNIALNAGDAASPLLSRRLSSRKALNSATNAPTYPKLRIGPTKGPASLGFRVSTHGVLSPVPVLTTALGLLNHHVQSAVNQE